MDTMCWVNRLRLNWKAGQFTNVNLLFGSSVQEPEEVQQSSQGLYFGQGNSDLKPSKIQTVELSFDSKLTNSIVLTGNLYAFRNIDSIARVPDPDAPNELTYVNLEDDETGAGIELAIRKSFSKSDLYVGVSAVSVKA